MLESVWFWTLATCLVVLILYVIGTWTHSHFSKLNITSLKPLPFIGTMGPVVFRKLSFADMILEKYNKLKGHKFGGVYEFLNPVILIRDPELIKQIAVKDFEFFLDHRSTINEDTDPLFGKSLINLTGQRWKDMRSTLSPAFTSSKMKMMFVLISECGDQLGNFLEDCIKDKQISVDGCKIEKDGDTLIVEMKDLFTRYTNDVIATAAFGIKCDSLRDQKNEFYIMGKDFTNFTGFRSLIFLGYLLSPKLMKLLNLKFMSQAICNFFRSLVHGAIQTRENKNIYRPDMINLLMQAKKGTLTEEENGKSVEKPKWDDDDITAQVVLFFFAGFETSSVLLCFMSHLLAVHPDIQSRLQEEIDQSLNENGGKLTYEAINSLKYLNMVVSETLRIYPPAVFTDRICIKEYTLSTDPPLTLKPGDGVWLPIYALHHDPDHFPNPEKFDPERFSDANKEHINPFAYLPFGSGPRSCIGNRFALMESKVALSHLLSRFNLKVVSKTSVPIRLSKKSFSMTAENGFWLGLEKRQKSYVTTK